MLPISREEHVAHYTSRKSSFPVFGYGEEERFGEDFFITLELLQLAHSREVQLTFGFDLPGDALAIITPKGGFTCAPDYPLRNQSFHVQTTGGRPRLA